MITEEEIIRLRREVDESQLRPTAICADVSEALADKIDYETRVVIDGIQEAIGNHGWVVMDGANIEGCNPGDVIIDPTIGGFDGAPDGYDNPELPDSIPEVLFLQEGDKLWDLYRERDPREI